MSTRSPCRPPTPVAQPICVRALLGPDLGWPSNPEMDWSRLADCPVVLVGTGAIGRPLADVLAFLGSRRFVLIDPNSYRERSIVTQCAPAEVGRFKAEVVAEQLGQPAIRLQEIIHMTWAALTFNLRLLDTVEWHGLNAQAAAYVRANRNHFPLTECGLFEHECCGEARTTLRGLRPIGNFQPAETIARPVATESCPRSLPAQAVLAQESGGLGLGVCQRVPTIKLR
jgi:hypothetical protein